MADLFRTPEEISQSIVNRLLERDATLAVEPGSVLRKLIDAVSGAMSDTTLEAHLNTFSMEIDTKEGEKLDNFVSMFGFARKSATLASGTVRFYSVESPSASDVIIPGSTIVVSPPTSTRPELRFRTVGVGLVSQGDSYTDVAIESVLPGSIYNLTSNEITVIGGGVSGIRSDVTNISATYGGSDQESDASLRERFKKTLFRGLAGTNEAFLGTALTNQSNTRAVVYGQTRRFEEQVQCTLVGADYIAYLSNNNVVVGTEMIRTYDDTTTNNGDNYYRRGSDYVINQDVNRAWIKVTSGGAMANTAKVIISYDYRPKPSRARFSNTYKNTVDVYADGVINQSAKDIGYYDTASIFNASNLLNAATAIGATTIPLIGDIRQWSNYGTGIIGSDVFNYTGKNLVTNSLTGVTGLSATHDKYDSCVETNNRIAYKLVYTPVDALPSTVTLVDSPNYSFAKGVAYDLVKDDNRAGTAGSWRAADYLVWRNSLIPNWSFEDSDNGTTGWAHLGTATNSVFARQTGWYIDGSASLRVTSSAGSASQYTGAGMNGTSNYITVTPSVIYRLAATANVQSAPSGSTVFVQIDWYTSGNALISSTTGSASTGTGVKSLSAVGTAPSNAAKANVVLRQAASTTTGTLDSYWDGIYFGAVQPTSGQRFSIENYTYNILPKNVEETIYNLNLRTIGQDTLVHQAKRVGLALNVVAMGQGQSDLAGIQSSMTDSIEIFLGRVQFGDWIQINDLLTAMRSILLVDNVRWVQSSEDATNYGIRIYDTDGNPTNHKNNGGYYTVDFKLEDDEIPYLHALNVTWKSQNTFNPS